ncbi:MAG: protein kinase [Cyanobacteriota/Melainabacteria group bacterium]
MRDSRVSSSLVPAMVHRDVTPENIMITEDGAVKLIDFSLAARADGTQTMESCGKQSYTPPEQFRNEVDPEVTYMPWAPHFILCSPAETPDR